jgi:hypothetical protein
MLLIDGRVCTSWLQAWDMETAQEHGAYGLCERLSHRCFQVCDRGGSTGAGEDEAIAQLYGPGELLLLLG